jgi:hypothetical protein
MDPQLKKENTMNIIPHIEDKIINIEGNAVIVDTDVALLYGVETKRINEAVRNNPDKFPDGYYIQLTEKEWNTMKSKFSTSIKGGKTKIPKAFTEKGLYMIATILKGEKATQTTIGIIETFAKIRSLGRDIRKLSEMSDENQRHPVLQKAGGMIAEIFESDLGLNETETSVELNFAVIKFKHTIKKGKKK